MKNKNIKFIAVFAIILTLSFSALPFSTDAATSTNSGGVKRATSTLRNSTSTKITQGNVGLRAKMQNKSTSTASSTKTVKATKLSKSIEDAIKKSDLEISKRVDSLNKTLEKVVSMKNVSESEKNSIKTEIQSEIAKLEALKAKINSDTDLTTIKKDMASITSGSRIYALVIPRANILASVDKINTIATMLGTITSKLQVRVDEAKVLGKDVTALQTALDNIIKKIADAKDKALTAETTVSDLAVDNGNKTQLDSNNTNIKLAKEDIKTANQYLSDARKSASVVTKGLRSGTEGKDLTDKGDKTDKTEKGSSINKKAKASTTKSTASKKS